MDHMENQQEDPKRPGGQNVTESGILKHPTPTRDAGPATAHMTPGDASAPRTIEQLTQPHTAWYSSNDEEVWSGGPYDTREEAEDEAKANEHRLIMQASKGPIRLSRFFDQADFIEQAEENLYDMANDDGDPILDFPPAVNLDLQARVRVAIDEWQVAHQLSPVAWRFDSSGPVEFAEWTKGGAA